MRLFKRLIQIFGVLLLIISGTLAITRRADAKSQFILFTRNNSFSDHDIYRVRFGGGPTEQLTAFPGQENLMWDFEQGWFYFVRPKVGSEGAATLYRMRFNGHHAEPIFSQAESIDMMNIENDWLYIERYSNNISRITRQRLDGTEKQLLAPPAQNYQILSYAEDYQNFTYWSDDAGGDIYWGTLDGSTIRHITHHGNVARNPIFKINGWLYYHTEVEIEGERNLRTFYRIPFEGGSPELLDENVSSILNIEYPVPMGADRRLIYGKHLPNKPLTTEVYLLDTATLEKRYLTTVEGNLAVQHWLEGGEWIYYTVQLTQYSARATPLYRLNLTTGEIQLVLDKDAAFSIISIPDYEWLFVSVFNYDPSTIDFYRIRPDGSEAALLVHDIHSGPIFVNQSDPNNIIYSSTQGGSLELYWMDLTTFETTKLTTGGPSGQFNYSTIIIAPPINLKWRQGAWLGLLGIGLLILPATTQWWLRLIARQKNSTFNPQLSGQLKAS